MLGCKQWLRLSRVALPGSGYMDRFQGPYLRGLLGWKRRGGVVEGEVLRVRARVIGERNIDHAQPGSTESG